MKVKAYLQGGLGNQCFIYATARALTFRKGLELLLSLDYLADDWRYKRKLALGPFDCVYITEDLASRVYRIVKAFRYKALRDCSWGCRSGCARIGNYCWDARTFRFRALPKKWCGTLSLDGYWQSEKYFYDIREQLLKDFCLKDDAWVIHDPVAQQICSIENPVFLHVRSYKEVPGREDGRWALQMIDYYRRAIDFMVEYVDHPVFFIFSDDILIARKLLSSLPSALPASSYVYVEPRRITGTTDGYSYPSDQIRDFTLMRLCKHGIVADSSFSWWAGWLGEQVRLMKGENPIRIHINRRVMNDDFWPERWVAI